MRVRIMAVHEADCYYDAAKVIGAVGEFNSEPRDYSGLSRWAKGSFVPETEWVAHSLRSTPFFFAVQYEELP